MFKIISYNGVMFSNIKPKKVSSELVSSFNYPTRKLKVFDVSTDILSAVLSLTIMHMLLDGTIASGFSH